MDRETPAQVIDATPALFGHYTAARIIAEAGFTLAHVRRAIATADAGLEAVRPRKRKRKIAADGSVEVTIEDGGTPDWDARLTASAQLLDVAGVRKRPQDDETSSTRPVAIQVVINQGPEGDVTDRVSFNVSASTTTSGSRALDNGSVDAQSDVTS